MSRIIQVTFFSAVYLNRSFTYLLVRKGERYNHYLRLHEGTVEVIRAGVDSDLVHALRPYPCSLHHAASVYARSTLFKTSQAENTLTEILDNWNESRIDYLAGDGNERPTRRERDQQKANMFTLESLCEELNIPAHNARAALRRMNYDKPGSRWEWPRDQREKIVEIIQGLMH